MNFAPFAADLVAGVDVDAILADLAEDGVAAPAAQVDGLRAVVANAADEGVALRVVVVDQDPFLPEQLRDLATSIGDADVGDADGGTILALSPHMMGSNSDTISRFQLEGAQAMPRTGDSTADVQAFVDQIAEPSLPWTAITAVLTLLVLLAAAAGTALNVRSHKRASQAATAAARPVESSPVGPGATDPGSADLS